MYLVIDIGHSQLRGGIFDGERLIDHFFLSCQPFDETALTKRLEGKKILQSLIASVNAPVEENVKKILTSSETPFTLLSSKDVKIALELEDKLDTYRIANMYGALSHFPQNDCIAIDIGKVVACDLVTMNGHYLGGVVFPGIEKIEKPEEILSGSKSIQRQNGLYYSLLGGLERCVAELRAGCPSPSSVNVVASGETLIAIPDLADDLQDFVDVINPYLTMVGLKDMLKELISKQEK